jgi:galactokinase
MCGRLCGAGFGGAAAALVREESLDEFMRAAAETYRQKTGIEPQLYVCTAEDGARVVG